MVILLQKTVILFFLLGSWHSILASIVAIENLPAVYHGQFQQVVRVDLRSAHLVRLYDEQARVLGEFPVQSFQEGLSRVRFVAELGWHTIELVDEKGESIEMLDFGGDHGLSLLESPLLIGEFIEDRFHSKNYVRIDVNLPVSQVKRVGLCYLDKAECVSAKHAPSALERMQSEGKNTTSWLVEVRANESFYLELSSTTESLVLDDNQGYTYRFIPQNP